MIDPISKVPTDLSDDAKTLEDYFPLEGQELHVKDCDPNQTLSSILNSQPSEDYRFTLSEEKEIERKENLKKIKDEKIAEVCIYKDYKILFNFECFFRLK